MCCLFGMIDCNGRFGSKQKSGILSVLATECEERGTDATGIAYCTGGHLSIYKRPAAAHKLRFHIPGDTRVVMGHTRMATQGNAIQNCNNHPFRGQAAGKRFALAHNGILYNDKYLRRSHALPDTRIETDSYIAVQLLQQKNALDFSSLKYMAEQVEGSFAFTVLDEKENLYFVKGDNPLCLYHYPRSGVYLYASTEDILKRALQRLRLPLEPPERVALECGDILRITGSGQQARSAFDASNLLLPWGNPSWWTQPRKRTGRGDAEQEYLEELKAVACSYGYTPETVDRLLESGFTLDEVEEFLYEVEMY